MVGINVWGGRRLKLYGVLIGIAAGYGLSVLAGLLTDTQFQDVAAAPWIGLPGYQGMWQISFSWSLLPGFAIVLHDAHWPAHGALQQTLSTQNVEAHWPPFAHAAPLASLQWLIGSHA